jgi:hypothetical protein
MNIAASPIDAKPERVNEAAEAKALDRTEADVMEGTALTVELGDKKYEIPPRRGRKHTRKIRQTLAKMIEDTKDVKSIVQGATSVSRKVASKEIEVLSDADCEFIKNQAVYFLNKGLDAMIDLAYDYAPCLEKDREYLEEEASDSQWVSALIVILGLIFGPLARLGQAVGLSKQPKAAETTPDPT